MENYIIYEWRIKPKSSFLTPLHSDIIFGHIIWAISENFGDELVEKIISESKEGMPPFIFSNGFESGKLPKINRFSKSDIFRSLMEVSEDTSKSGKIKIMSTLKKYKKIKDLDIDMFNSLREKGSGKEILNLLNRVDISSSNSKTQYIVKNTINRLDGSTQFKTDDGETVSGLYGNSEVFYSQDTEMSIYIKVRKDFDINTLEKALTYVENTGYGKKKSTGKGNFENIFFKKTNVFDKNLKNPNGYIVLSNYVPKENDYIKLIDADIATKRGKVSGGYSLDENVFKKPFVHYTPGSVFFTDSPFAIKGKVLENIHYKKEIVQFMIPFTVEVEI